MVDLVSVGEPLGRRRQRLRQQQQQRVLVFTLGGAKGLRGSSAVGGYLRPQPPALWMFGSRPASLQEVPRGTACFAEEKIGRDGGWWWAAGLDVAVGLENALYAH